MLSPAPLAAAVALVSALFGDRFQLAGDRNQVAQYANDRRGQMIATSVGATTMGRGCDTAILDDPVSADQAVSDAERTTANTWIAFRWWRRKTRPGPSRFLGESFSARRAAS